MMDEEFESAASGNDRFSTVVPVRDDWYVACASRDLGRKPHTLTLYGRPLVLFRDEYGRPAALLDRCPHRNAPLSTGAVRDGTLECGYHGWRFDREGACRFVPGLMGNGAPKGRDAEWYACREQDGFVWVYATPGEAPSREPFRFPLVHDPRYTVIRQTLDMEGTIHAVAENALDVPHTAFLHRGLFRSGASTREIEVRVSRTTNGVEAEYVGEPRPEGILGRLLAPSGGVVEHFDRFFLPSIAEVEYRLGASSHIVLTTALTPLDDFRTRLFAVACFRLPLPGRLVGAVLSPLALRVLRQDAAILAKQTQTIRRFGGERYASTEIDVLGPSILKLLRSASRGERGAIERTATRSFRMRV